MKFGQAGLVWTPIVLAVANLTLPLLAVSWGGDSLGIVVLFGFFLFWFVGLFVGVVMAVKARWREAFAWNCCAIILLIMNIVEMASP